MSQFDSPSTSPASSEFGIPTEPPAWPKVVGIISIVLGSLGTLCGVCGAVFILGMNQFMQQMGQLQQQGGGARGGQPTIPSTPMPAELSPGVLSMVATVFWPIGTVLMLAAGIATLRRAAAGRTLHLAYAVLSAVFTLVGIAGSYQYQQSTSAFMSAHPDDPWVKFFTQGGGMSGQFVQGLIIGCVCLAYPIFCIVWFGVLGKRPNAGAALQEPLV